MYFQEQFTPQEETVLRRFFTNTVNDSPVFALINLPEVVKGALFARYSRTDKSLRRLFLDEFYRQPDTGIQAIAAQTSPEDPEAGLKRAEALYERVLSDYGDDSIAQLGGAHLACEQASNILTKVLEWGRLAAYLEQSTRYIFYDRKLGDRFRYHIPPEVEARPDTAQRYRLDMDWLFQTYSQAVRDLALHFEKVRPRKPGEADLAWRAALRTQACDVARGLLPAATLSNVGIFASGQAYEALILRMRAHPLQEARDYAGMMLTELRKVIPAFLKRVDVPDRGGDWTRYFVDTAKRTGELAAAIIAQPEERTAVTLVEWDPDAEVKTVAAALYGHSDLPDDQLLGIARAMSGADREAVLKSYVGDRANRRHKPGRAMERSSYRFDIICDFGAFRDLQRHRMLTIEWQRLGAGLGYAVPEAIEATGRGPIWHEAMDRMTGATGLHALLFEAHGPDVAQYAVPFAHRIRFVVQLNAREAFHMLELRTTQQGHPAYRSICQEMHRLIREQAGHRAIADAMTFVDYRGYDLARIKSAGRSIKRAAELKTRQRRSSQSELPGLDSPVTGAPEKE